MKLATLLVAGTILATPATALAQEASPQPTPYQYPNCKDDPDVSCYTPYGETPPPTTYESGHYPPGWIEAHYAAKGQDVYGKPLATPAPYYPTGDTTNADQTAVTPPEATPAPTPAAVVKQYPPTPQEYDQSVIDQFSWIFQRGLI